MKLVLVCHSSVCVLGDLYHEKHAKEALGSKAVAAEREEVIETHAGILYNPAAVRPEVSLSCGTLATDSLKVDSVSLWRAKENDGRRQVERLRMEEKRRKLLHVFRTGLCRK